MPPASTPCAARCVCVAVPPARCANHPPLATWPGIVACVNTYAEQRHRAAVQCYMSVQYASRDSTGHMPPCLQLATRYAGQQLATPCTTTGRVAGWRAASDTHCLPACPVCQVPLHLAAAGSTRVHASCASSFFINRLFV